MKTKKKILKTIEKQLLDEEQLVTFKIDKEDYAIKINFVQEITRMTEITRIPRAPYFIDGIVNLRGNIIPALNLRKLFEMNEKQVTDSTRIIIVDLNNKKTGIIVDEVSEVLRFEKNLIESSPDILSQGKTNKYIDGVGKIDNGNRMVIILKLDQILNFNNI
ncbi:chemotaxis signal transduction protein [Clostridium beijerinckii]|uniref:chemotaxis protein CheW n=1 Tax=Clostridium beijerinckii TaxID=1520 RepID=UPI001570273F|nr:chemotaxis protein CheW [Clostridium beijerinckii]NRZ10965.1 chemotaxis signal transduction protein [Clostridium beijerinckii]NRZ85823.1 chemotaxis signal transduction protein [Clostridium beijerinckii]